ncbi:ABC transporter permease [Mycoplasma sp. 888]|uniref:ABC transporter permease n=1 Tax=Mycoplasma sp. 888 TaxID=3108483 RepID=UPI002D77F3B8|nr:ABC transporter permease [Mycoplasma sp. 888]WRQ25557.1 ABC transporter permease [Mycoplasma sp. 888]
MNSKTNKFNFTFDKKTHLVWPYFLIALLLIILPIILIVLYALIPNESFDNWVLIKSSSTWKIMGRSLWIGLAASMLCLIIGFPYAYFVSTSKSKIFKICALSLIISPLAIFTIARIYSIKALFLGIMAHNTKSLNNEAFMVFGLMYLNLPLMIMPLYTVFKDMPKNIIEASHDLGYNQTQTIFKVIIPYGIRAILSGFGMVFLASATTFVISAKLLPDGSQYQTVGDIINSRANPGNKFDLAAVSVLVIVVSAIFLSIYGIILITPKIIFRLKKGAHYE